MRKVLFVMLMSILSFMSAYAYKNNPEYLAARERGAIVRMIIRIVDDAGNPVPHTKIYTLMGMNFREKSYVIEGVTNEEGVFVVEGVTTGNEVQVKAEKDGYYRASRDICFSKMGEEFDVKDGHWSPWEMNVPLRLRRVRHPANLIVCNDYMVVPTTNAWIGFDMEKKDWTPPYGKGEVTDFDMLLRWDGKPQYYTEQTELSIRFVTPESGYYVFDNVPYTEFGGVYEADTNQTFSTERIFSSGRKNGVLWQRGLDVRESIVMRSRCRINAEGRIISANYSTIKDLGVVAGWKGKVKIRIRYFFNPRVNDIVLEPTN